MNNNKKEIFSWFVKKRMLEFDEIKIKNESEYPINKSGKIIKNDNISYSGCMGALSNMPNKISKFYFPNAFGVPLNVLKKYVEIIINLNDFYSNHIKNIEVTKKGITCLIVSTNTLDWTRLNLFLVYFFRAICLKSLEGYAYYVVKGVKEGLNYNEALHAASLCVHGSSNYFCYNSTIPITIYNKDGFFKQLPFAISDLFLKNLRCQKDVVPLIKKNQYIVNSFFKQKNEKCDLSSLGFSKSIPLNEENNFIKKEILNFYEKESCKNNFNLYDFYKKLTEITNKYSFKIVITKKRIKEVSKNFTLNIIQGKFIVISKKTKKQERFYIPSKSGGIIHLNKKNIKKIIA